jgi:prepilin-type N-terminal cleavage/methylation domain-containing protein
VAYFIFAGGAECANLNSENGFCYFWSVSCKTIKATHQLNNESESVKIRFINQKVIQFPPRGRAGMTLVEVLVAMAIAVLMVGGIVTGYIFSTQSTVKDSLYMAANARAMERMEQTRGAQWDTASFPPTNQLVAANFPDKIITLDLSGSGSVTNSATIKTQISTNTNPLFTAPLLEIRVDCIWQFKGVLITNSIETSRAPN